MNSRLLNFLLLLVLFASAPGAGSVLAQSPEPPQPTPPPPPPIGPAPWELEPASPHAPLSTDANGNLAAQGVSLGEPGLSFRYAATFGQTAVAYPSDTAHLNYPWGIGLDNTGNIWIGELLGNRAMKYDGAGNFVQQIGVAGMAYQSNTTIWEIADVGVDGGGNIWVVDEAASHIAKFDSAGNFVKDLGTPWIAGADNSHFATPASIAFDAAGNIYVSDGSPWSNNDTGNQRIQVLNPSGTARIATIGSTGVIGTANNRFRGPRHIAIDKMRSLLYVADTGNQRVQIFNISSPAAPTYVATIGTTGVKGTDNLHFNRPSGVAVGSDYIYVADTLNHRVQVFNRIAPYSWVATLGKTGTIGTDSDHFNNPVDVAVDGGNLYVADFVNTRVQKYTHIGADFTYVGTYGTVSKPYLTDSTHYNQPSGVAIDSAGNIILTEDRGQRLMKLSPAGAKIWEQGLAGVKGDWSSGNTEFNNPADVAIDAADRIYVADRWNRRVQIYDPGGDYLTTIGDLKCPGGVHVAPDGLVYLANTCDQTVKVYSSSLSLIATMGKPGVAGTDNAHFNAPEDVAVDGNGTIYVADQRNDRVQVYNSSRAYVRTIGVTGVCAADFAHLCVPEGLFVDGANRLYVADTGNSRVQVFDSTGAYLATIGGSWGTGTGRFRSPTGVGGDSAGNLYVADRENHRLLKFAPGVPGWSQMNINGFGDRGNGQVSALAPFGGLLYAGTTNKNGAQLWRSSNGLNWSLVKTNGFGIPANVAIEDLFEFKGNLYASTWNCADTSCSTTNGGQLWRSADGTNWSQVIIGGTLNAKIYRLEAFNNTLYAATWSWSPAHGGEIRSSSDGSSWTIVVPNGFADINNSVITSLEVLNGWLYAGTYNPVGGGEVWRCSICSGTSTDWTWVNLNGFGDAGNGSISSLAASGSYLYASTMHSAGAGAEIWRCTICDGTDWTQVANNGFGNIATYGDGGLQAFNGQLYFVVGNSATGAEVWRCTVCDGTDWAQSGFAGFGDSNNGVDADKTAIFGSRLFIGTANYANGGEIWSPPALPYPVVTSIKLMNPSPTNAPSVSFIVTFSENVTGVDIGDFRLTTAGLTGASITGFSGSGNTYLITAARGTGNGTLRLDLLDDDSIVDEATGAKHLGGTGAGNGNFTTGEFYAFTLSMSFKSIGAQDGWVLESGENTDAGGLMNVGGSAFNLGDNAARKQYRGILSFNTANLPDNAVVVSITLKIRKSGASGANPFNTLGNILADVKNGDFGTAALQVADFQAAATLDAAMEIQNQPLAGGWYSATLGSAADALVNKLGDTQIRLRFAQDDNNNNVANYLAFYSGNAAVANKPMLLVQYYLP